jgi:WD40 repeat protein
MLDFRSYSEKRSLEFIGREWIFSSVDAWLAEDPRTRVYLITGEPGCGKTSIAARLHGYSSGITDWPPNAKCIRRGFLSAIHFCSARDAGWIDPLRFVQSISQQLAERYPAFQAELLKMVPQSPITATSQFDVKTNLGQLIGLYIANLNITGSPKPSSVFVQIVRTPLESLFAQDANLRVTVLVDAIDEAEAAANQGDSIASLIAATEDFPRGVQFIVTTRPIPSIERNLRRLSSVDAEVSLTDTKGKAQTERDVAAYVANILGGVSGSSNAVASKIAQRAGSNFLYAHLAIAVFKGVRAEDADAVLARMPSGLDALYLEYLDRLPGVKQHWSALYRPILGTLAVAREPLTVSELTTLVGFAETSVLDSVTALSPLLHIEGAPRTYRLYHETFADFLDGESSDQYRCKASLFHESIARAQVGKPSGTYALRWLGYHLAMGGRKDDLRRLLLDFGYLQAKLNNTGPGAIITEYNYLPGDADLQLLQAAIRLSAGVVAGDPGQFASQLVGRLLACIDSETIRAFVESVPKAAPRPWLRPLRRALQPPGTGLIWTLEGYRAAQIAAAITPDGSRAITGSPLGSIYIWDLDRGLMLRNLDVQNSVTSVAVTVDGRFAISGHAYRTSANATSGVDESVLRFWNLETGHVVHALNLQQGVTVTAITPDGHRAVFGVQDMTLNIWDLESGRILRTLVRRSQMVGVEVTSDGRRLIAAFANRSIEILDLDSGRTLHRIGQHEEESARSAAMTRDGRFGIFAFHEDCRPLEAWDLELAQIKTVLEGHTGKVWSVAVTDDGRVVSGSSDQTIKVWNLENGRVLATLGGHSDNVLSLAVSRDGHRAISGSFQELKVWDLTSQQPIEPGVEMRRGRILAVSGRQGALRAISASDDGALEIWDVETGTTICALNGHTDTVNSAVVTSDGRHLVSASNDKTLKVWDLQGGNVLRTIEGAEPIKSVSVARDGLCAVSCSNSSPGSPVDSVIALSADGRRAIACSPNEYGTFVAWDLSTCRASQTFEFYNGPRRIEPGRSKGRPKAPASWTTALWEWNLEDQSLKILEGSQGARQPLALTPDGRRAVCGSHSLATLSVWNLEKGSLLHVLNGHSDVVTNAAVTPDGRNVITGSQDKKLKVWDLESGAMIATFSCDSSIYSCAVAEDGTLVASDQANRIYVLTLER